MAIGYAIGKQYGTLVGTAGGAMLGSVIGGAIEDWLNSGMSMSDYFASIGIYLDDQGFSSETSVGGTLA